MKILVTNWTNWLGYHLVNKLLREGYQVDGLINDREQRFNHFAAYFARNSLFSFVEAKELSNYTEIIVLGDVQLNIKPSRRLWLINCNLTCDGRKCIFVSTPILYGEWMPLHKKGIYYGGQKIYFASERFKREAIYIGDFLHLFLQWLNSAVVPQRICLKTRDQIIRKETISLENHVCFRDNRPKSKNTKRLKIHYENHQQFYLHQTQDFNW